MSDFTEYHTHLHGLIRALNTATGLSWAHQMTGGGCDRIETTDDQNRLIMITDGDASVPDEHSTEWLINIYADANGTDLIAGTTVAGFAWCLHALREWRADGTITLSALS